MYLLTTTRDNEIKKVQIKTSRTFFHSQISLQTFTDIIVSITTLGIKAIKTLLATPIKPKLLDKKIKEIIEVNIYMK